MDALAYTILISVFALVLSAAAAIPWKEVAPGSCGSHLSLVFSTALYATCIQIVIVVIRSIGNLRDLVWAVIRKMKSDDGSEE